MEQQGLGSGILWKIHSHINCIEQQKCEKIVFFVMREIDENNEVLYTVKPVSFNTNFLIFFLQLISSN